MENSFHSEIENNYRALYGKLFSALIRQFGTVYVNEIEDAIQNAFLKSLKAWSLSQTPLKRENWLFVVARNDILNQIRAKKRIQEKSLFADTRTETGAKDLRLEVIMLISSAKRISKQAKVVFILKNLFGLSVREISEATLMSRDATYKAINRAKASLQDEFEGKTETAFLKIPGDPEIATAEDILYAVFNIGFDSFDEKIQSMVNEDLCLEAMALTKVLLSDYDCASTKNLMALFCFHSARIQAKMEEGRLVSFFKQDRKKWDGGLMSLGFTHLRKPEKLSRFYLEALITAKHMTEKEYGTTYWNDISQLYYSLVSVHPSPVVKLNLCYVLHRAEQTEEALNMLSEIEKELPVGHLYFSLIKAELLKRNEPGQSEKILFSVFDNLESGPRKEFISENGFIGL